MCTDWNTIFYNIDVAAVRDAFEGDCTFQMVNFSKHWVNIKQAQMLGLRAIRFQSRFLDMGWPQKAKRFHG